MRRSSFTISLLTRTHFSAARQEKLPRKFMGCNAPSVFMTTAFSLSDCVCPERKTLLWVRAGFPGLPRLLEMPMKKPSVVCFEQVRMSSPISTSYGLGISEPETLLSCRKYMPSQIP